MRISSARAGAGPQASRVGRSGRSRRRLSYPVVAADGETYEREAIEEHFRVKQTAIDDAVKEFRETDGESNRAIRVLKTGITSPMGHGCLEITTLTPSRLAKRDAEEWRQQHRA